jgi:hypothetical protein
MRSRRSLAECPPGSRYSARTPSRWATDRRCQARHSCSICRVRCVPWSRVIHTAASAAISGVTRTGSQASRGSQRRRAPGPWLPTFHPAGDQHRGFRDVLLDRAHAQPMKPGDLLVVHAIDPVSQEDSPGLVIESTQTNAPDAPAAPAAPGRAARPPRRGACPRTRRPRAAPLRHGPCARDAHRSTG